MTICFDVNECLIDKKNKAIKANVELLKVLSKKHKVFVWSGNKYEYAFEIVKELKIEKYISGILNKYNTFVPDIAFDDQEIDLGKLNIVI